MPNFNQRNYHRIFTGTNQLEGSDKICLGYEASTTDIEFKKDSTTFFHVPLYATTQNLSSGQIVGDGAIPGPIPAMADRIFKKQGNYGNTTPWGTTTDIPNGTWLCSWLYSLSGETPRWFDRFYNPGKVTYDYALLGELNYETYDENNPVFVDLPSSIRLESGVLYQYFHNGEKTAESIINTFSGPLSTNLRLNVQTWAASGIDNTIYNNNFRITNFKNNFVLNSNEPGVVDRNALNFDNKDFLDAKVSYSDNYNLPNEFTINFWVQNKNWSTAPATQLVGNLNYGGYGISYNNLKYYPFFAIPETFYGHLYYYNQEGLNYSDKSTQSVISFISPELSGSSSPIQVNVNSDNEVLVLDKSNPIGIYKFNHLGDVLAVPRLSSGEPYIISGEPKQFIIDQFDGCYLQTTEAFYYFDNNLTFVAVSSIPYIDQTNGAITEINYSYNTGVNIVPGTYTTTVTGLSTSGQGVGAVFEIQVNSLSAISDIFIPAGGSLYTLNQILSVNNSILPASGSVNLTLTSTSIGFGGILTYDLSGNILREPPCIDTKYDNGGKKWVVDSSGDLFVNGVQQTNFANCSNITIDPESNVWVFYGNNNVTKINTTTLSAITSFELGIRQPDINNVSFIYTYDRVSDKQQWYSLVYRSNEKTLYQVTLDGDIARSSFIPDSTNIVLTPPEKEDKNFMKFNGKGDFTGYEWKRIFNKVLYNNNPQLQFKIIAQKPLRGTPLKTFTLSVPVQYLTDETWHLITGTLKNRTLSLYVDTRLRDEILLPGNYSVSYLRKNDLYIGTPTGKFTNLNTELNSQALIFNGYIDNIRIYDYAIKPSFLNMFVRGYFEGENLIWSIPTSQIQYIEGIERFFKHKAPGSKSIFFKVKLSGLSITDENTRAMIEASIKAAIERTKPAYSELISVEWV